MKIRGRQNRLVEGWRGKVRLQGEVMVRVEDLKCFRSTLQSNHECGKDVKKRLYAGWNGWKKVSGVLGDA